MVELSNDGREFVKGHTIDFGEENGQIVFHISCENAEHSFDVTNEMLKKEDMFMCVCGEIIRKADLKKLLENDI